MERTTVSKEQYVQLMKRIYKVLLPLYREKEMASEIENEWLMDSAGNHDMSLHLFTKLMFRIAHQWATHINLDEYIEILFKIYYRITVRRVIVSSTSEVKIAMPTIQCEVVPPPSEGPDPF